MGNPNKVVESSVAQVTPFEERIDAMRHRTPEQIAAMRQRVFAVSRRALPLPPGKFLEDVVVGALPDERSEEEILVALKELS